MARATTAPPVIEKTPLQKAIILTVVIGPFIAFLYAVVMLWNQYVTALDLILFFVFFAISGLGITVGFHRLLTHRAFETHPVIKAFWLICGCTALESNPIWWAATHIRHHAHSDEDDDPHSPLAGFWHAHLGWMFKNHDANMDVYGAWLRKDPVVVWVDKTWFLWFLLSLAIPFAIGGWSGLLWGGLVRVFFTHHVTWSVNSVCHTFGKRDYNTTDASRNNFIVGLLAWGEGWHNNHHAFPRSAFHGLRWWQVDVSGYLIRLMELTKMAWNVQRVRPDQEKRRSGFVTGGKTEATEAASGD
ncbi:MAG: acyl-CoA desaturase [Chloroflexaceae bacterium]|jgi:stearoyl-CoA desaturase (delta-9 desaturase)|nr:acyl-CoA desaturase [Chloroflexaceae bacterium]